MKLILEGNFKQVNQIKKELVNRCKRDKIHISEILEENEVFEKDYIVEIEQKVIKPIKKNK